MIITELKLSNFGIHRDLSFRSDKNPVVGLLGKNGAGKSTILNAVKYAFTGEIEGTLEEAVTFGCTTGYVELTFLKDNKQGKIKREVGKTPKRHLIWDGETITAAKNIEVKLGEILSVDKKAFSNACFLKQGSLNELLFGTESSREQLFIKLVNLSFCEKHKNTVDTKIKCILSGIEDLNSVLDEVTNQRLETLGIKTSLETDMEDILDYSEIIDLISELQFNHKDITTAEQDINELTSEIRGYELQIKTIHDSYKVNDLEQLKGVLFKEIKVQEVLNAERVEAVESINLFRDYTGKFKALSDTQLQLKKNQEALTNIEADLSSLPQPKTISEDKVTEFNALSAELIQLGSWLAVQEGIQKNGGSVQCLQCGLKLSEDNDVTDASLTELKTMIDEKAGKKLILQELVQEVEADNVERVNKVKSLGAAVETVNAQIKVLEELKDTQLAAVTLASAGATFKEDELPSVSEIGDRIKEQETHLDTIKKDTVTYETVTNLLNAKRLNLTTKSQKIDLLNTILVNNNSKLNKMLSCEEDRNKEDLTLLGQHYGTEQKDRLEAEGRVKQASDAYDTISQRYHELKNRMEENADKLVIAEELGQVVKVLSRSGLPRVFVEHKFKILAGITAENLAILNSDFTVDVDEDAFLSFVFDRFDGQEQVRLPMSKLSGGQKVRLCIAFLLAVQQELVTEVGFQTFDEPSTHLDEEGVDRLCSLFKRLQELLNTAEHQVWVCDHNPILEDAFNKTLVLQ